MDIILYNIGVSLLMILIGYLSGSIPNAIWIGKVFFHKDPRDYGSKNAGGTNAGRVFGKGIGVLVIILDALKTILPIYLSWLILTKIPMYNNLPLVPDVTVTYGGGDISNYLIKWPVYWFSAVGVILGHCWPIFAGFKGGKSVSAYYGLTLGCNWFIGIIAVIAFAIPIIKKKYVSLASIIASWVGTLFAWVLAIFIMTGALSGPFAYFTSYGPSLDCNFVFAIVVTFNATILTIRHKANIQRLKDGTESKVTWLK